METKLQWSEYRFVGLVVVVVLLVTSVPYAYASISAPPDKQFMGVVFNTSDHAQYLAWYREFQTSFLIPNTLTPEANPAVFFNLLWFVLGRLGHTTGWSFPVTYQIFRWVAGAFFLGMVYTFASLFFPDVRWRRTAFLITTLGSGLGWIWVVVKYTLASGELLFPMDVYVAEGNSFFCVMAYPHFAEAAGLILAVLSVLLVGERRGQLRYAILAGLIAHFLGWQHGYDLVIVWGIPSFYAGVKFLVDRQWPRYWIKAMLITGLLSWPPAVYSVLLTRLNPIWEEVLAQFSNAGVFTPDPLHMVVLMGCPLILAAVTLVLLILRPITDGARELPTPQGRLFIGVWFVAGWALTYIPTDFQIHMLNSWQVPIGLLATIGLYTIIAPALTRWMSTRRSRAVIVLAFLGLISITNGYLLAWRLLDLSRFDYPYFLDRNDVIALEWLEEHAPADAIVLSSYEVGRYVPGLTGRRPFLAHWAQTVGFYDKRDRVARFFDGQTDETDRLETLQTFGIDYVFHGPAERLLGQYDPSTSSLFEPVFHSPRVAIYRFAQVHSHKASD